MRPILFSKHAKRRLHERSIKESDVEKTIRNPDYTVRRFEDEIEAFKKLNGNTLKVVFADKEKYIRVITLYWIR